MVGQKTTNGNVEKEPSRQRVLTTCSLKRNDYLQIMITCFLVSKVINVYNNIILLLAFLNLFVAIM